MVAAVGSGEFGKPPGWSKWVWIKIEDLGDHIFKFIFSITDPIIGLAKFLSIPNMHHCIIIWLAWGKFHRNFDICWKKLWLPVDFQFDQPRPHRKFYWYLLEIHSHCSIHVKLASQLRFTTFFGTIWRKNRHGCAGLLTCHRNARAEQQDQHFSGASLIVP
jgi:hypothetical protein